MNFWPLVLEDLRTQREGAFAQAFWVLLIYRFSHMRMARKSRFVRVPWRLLNIMLQKLAEMLFGMALPESTVIGRRLRIEHFGPLVIHGAVQIGDDCLLRHSVTIGNKGAKDPHGAPRIGSFVEVGAGAVIIGRITIGDGAVIGANAVVTRDVKPGETVAGNPARTVRQP